MQSFFHSICLLTTDSIMSHLLMTLLLQSGYGTKATHCLLICCGQTRPSFDIASRLRKQNWPSIRVRLWRKTTTMPAQRQVGTVGKSDQGERICKERPPARPPQRR